MSDLLRLVVDLFSLVWPLHVCRRWESCLLYICGWYVGELGVGLKVGVPWFFDFVNVSTVPGILQTPRQTITLRDGKTLTFVASLTYRVESPFLAYNTVERWSETTVEEASGLLAELLAEEDPERLTDPSRGKRKNVRKELAEAIDEATSLYGVRISSVRFNDFVIDAPTVRLLQDGK